MSKNMVAPSRNIMCERKLPNLFVHKALLIKVYDLFVCILIKNFILYSKQEPFVAKEAEKLNSECSELYPTAGLAHVRIT